MASTMRALSGEEELDVSFGPGAPSLRGNRDRFLYLRLGVAKLKSMPFEASVTSSRSD